MENRIRNQIENFSATPRLRSAVWIVFSVLLILPLLSFYPWKFRIGFVLLFILYAWVDVLSPLVGTFLVVASGVFFGNHPGGRFLEIQDCLWIFWCVRGIIENRLHGNSIFDEGFWKRPIGILLILFWCSGFLSLLANPDLILDLRFYQKGWFWFLHSTELEPNYPWKLLFLGVLFCYGFIARKNWLDEKYKNSEEFSAFVYIFSGGIVFGAVVSIGFGWAEYFFPFVKNTLNSYHTWLDGYKLVALPHSLIPSLEKYLPKEAIQSLFWNRSWFAIYLISSLPFFWEFLGNDPKNHNFRIFKKEWIWLPLAVSILGITFFWIGARGGVLSFAAFCVITLCVWFYFSFVKNEVVIRVLSFSFAGLFVVGAILFPLFVVGTQGGGSGDPERLSHFIAGLKLASEKPLLGGGFESFGWYNECCLNPLKRESAYHTTHNQTVQIFSGLGFLGLVVYSLLWGILLYGLLRFRNEKKSVLHSSLIVGSVSAVFIYSFFQEWFYLRAVYFQWIVLFLIFGNFADLKLRFPFEKSLKNIQLLAIVSFVLLLGSWIFFPTKTYLSGIYFPPVKSEGGAEQRRSEAWVLAGEGKMTLVSKPDLYDVWPDWNLEKGSLSLFVSGGKWREYKPTKFEEPREYLTLQTIEGENLLKSSCVLLKEPNFLQTLIFWKFEPIDPEPRKICSRIRIQKYL
ncbi:O-antigen ligase family protein [Leptospira barantonii]|uniref:Ligase n=1 Tax=Leptospira barantonii TaxID=2023184 RepID=A0ABX4NJI6_9LEPT|nr:O-antigen ligase family protein [Leptospira barantonii]PJZ55827.1 ligase [Leptospira barantonii]